MAEVGELDFSSFVAKRRAPLPSEREVPDEFGNEYAYSSDRVARRAFETAMPMQLAVEACIRVFENINQAQLLGQAVKVGPRQLSRVHSITKSCAETLNIEIPDVYLVNSPYLNAATYGTHDHSFIMVHSALVDHFSDEELTSVIGHECGHIHNRHVVYLTVLHVLGSMARYLGPLAFFGSQLSLQAWSRRAEITCDRAGALCTRDMEVSTRALAKLALGSRKLYDELDIDVFLEQYEESRGRAGAMLEVLATHPWLPKRILALRSFQKSELFKRHVRPGDAQPEEAGLSIEEVDERVHEIIKVV